MSWGINAVGKPAAVAAACQAQAASSSCAEPEETVKNQIVAAIVAACGGFNDKTAVRVVAHGSMSTSNGTPDYNSASLTIEPLYGFVE